jgi:hypothetical protein
LDVVHLIWGHIRKITNFSMMYIYIKILLNIVKWKLSIWMQRKVHNALLYITNKKRSFVHCKHWNSFSYQKPNLGTLCGYALPMMINWLIDEKTKLILWKLSSIQMRILNEIACNLNWFPIQQRIKIQLNWKKMKWKLAENLLKIFLWRWCWKRNVTLLPN